MLAENPYSFDPDVLYSWTVTGQNGDGSCGVTDSVVMAERHVFDSLEDMPGETGTVSLVRLDTLSMHPRYTKLRTMYTVSRDPSTGKLRKRWNT